MSRLIVLLISFFVVFEYSGTCVAGRRIVKRQADGGAEVVGTDVDEGGGFPPYNYTVPADSDDAEHVDFDLDAATTVATPEGADVTPEGSFLGFDTQNLTQTERWMLRATEFSSIFIFIVFLFLVVGYAMSVL